MHYTRLIIAVLLKTKCAADKTTATTAYVYEYRLYYMSIFLHPHLLVYMCEHECVKPNGCTCIVYHVLNCLLIGRYILQGSICKDLIKFLMHLCRPKTLWLIRPRIAASEI